jgi:hypothetical protein
MRGWVVYSYFLITQPPPLFLSQYSIASPLHTSYRRHGHTHFALDGRKTRPEKFNDVNLYRSFVHIARSRVSAAATCRHAVSRPPSWHVPTNFTRTARNYCQEPQCYTTYRYKHRMSCMSSRRSAGSSRLSARATCLFRPILPKRWTRGVSRRLLCGRGCGRVTIAHIFINIGNQPPASGDYVPESLP